MMGKRIIDMTTGSPAKLIFRFMIPLLGSSIIQQLYTISDAIIVGKGVGVDALAAIGATDMLRSFAVWGIAGFSDGFGILLTIMAGQKNWSMVRSEKSLSVKLSIIIALIVSLFGVFFASPLLRLTHAPQEIFAQAQLYMTIIYAGTTAMMMYNIGAAILRAVGDSRTPFIGILTAAVTNIGLDLVAVYILHWGLAGTAIATVIAQTISACYCFYVIRRMQIFQKEEGDECLRGRRWIGRFLAKGAPMAFQNSFIAIGGVILQSVINEYGFNYVAAFSATNKLYLVMEGAAIAMGGAMVTFVGQNYGAGRLDRVRQGMRSALIGSIVTALLIGGVLILFGKPILLLFLSRNAKSLDVILGIAYRYLTIMCALLIILYLVHVFRESTMGLGNTVFPMLSGLGEFSFRVFMALIGTKFLGAMGLYLAEPAAWFGADLVLIPSFFVVWRRAKKLLQDTPVNVKNPDKLF